MMGGGCQPPTGRGYVGRGAGCGAGGTPIPAPGRNGRAVAQRPAVGRVRAGGRAGLAGGGGWGGWGELLAQ